MCTSEAQISQWKLWNTSLKTQSSEQANQTTSRVCPSVHTRWVNEYRESDSESALKSTPLYEETKLNMGLTQTLISKTSLGKTDCLRTCVRAKASMQGWGYAPVWICQSIKQRCPQQSNSLHHLSLIMDLRQAVEWKGNMSPSISLRTETRRHPVLNQ